MRVVYAQIARSARGFFMLQERMEKVFAASGERTQAEFAAAVGLGLERVKNLIAGRVIPSMVQYIYTAGLVDVQRNYPELLDCIKKSAVCKIVADAYLPQSGSISADGLSESVSVDLSKYHEAIDHILNGPPGSNGGLMSKIHGVRIMVM